MTIRRTWEPPRAPVIDPKTGKLTREGFDWFNLLYEKLGKASPDAPIRARNITELLDVAAQVTGELKTENAVINLIKSITNDATCDSIDAGTNATIRVYGQAGPGTAWNLYRNGVIVRTFNAVTVLGTSYTTRYYVSYDIPSDFWRAAQVYKDVLADNMVIFSVFTVAGGGGGGVSGGGASGLGGFGGVDSSGRAGYGMVL